MTRKKPSELVVLDVRRDKRDAKVVITPRHKARWEKLRSQVEETLTSIEKQEAYIFETHLYPMPCPLCSGLVGSREDVVMCPWCKVDLERVVPFVCQPGTPGWHWTLEDEDRETLRELWADSCTTAPKYSGGEK
jgi:hypothetical protein